MFAHESEDIRLLVMVVATDEKPPHKPQLRLRN
jgi:hypothetical protein